MELKELYEQIGGDYDDVISRLPREASIIKYLKRFCEDIEYASMTEAYHNGNYKGVFESSHSLKGLCSNLGLRTLYEAISAICELMRPYKSGGVSLDVDTCVELEALMENARIAYMKVVDAITREL